MSADESQQEAERVEKPDYATASETVGRAEGHGRWTRLLVFLTKRLHVIVGVAIAAGAVLLLALGIELSRSQAVIAGSFAVCAVVLGWPTGRKAAELMGGPQLMWLVDVDLLDRDGAGIYSCPTPRWSEEWTVVEDDLWWATPNLAFGKEVDLEARTVKGTWPGSLPEPVLMRALSYLRWNRKVLEEKAKRGEQIELNAFGLVRRSTIGELKKIVRTFESGTLPDDNEAFLEEVDRVLDDAGLGDELIDPDDGDDPASGAVSIDEENREFSFDVDLAGGRADD